MVIPVGGERVVKGIMLGTTASLCVCIYEVIPLLLWCGFEDCRLSDVGWGIIGERRRNFFFREMTVRNKRRYKRRRRCRGGSIVMPRKSLGDAAK